MRQVVVAAVVSALRTTVEATWTDTRTLALYMPTETPERLTPTLEFVSRVLSTEGIAGPDGRLHFTCAVGLAPVSDGNGADAVLDRAERGLVVAEGHLDLVPRVGSADPLGLAPKPKRNATRTLAGGAGRSVALTYLLGLGAPFLLYELVWRSTGHNITAWVYPFIAVAVVATAWLIWSECLRALPMVQPPESRRPTPQVSAIIAAYLPNEAATIEETVEAFLAQEHPHGLQLILAYNRPQRLPVEDRLEELAARDPRLTLLNVEHSTSKAQNVNAALPMVTGEMVGVFDADHHPAPGSFDRAWRWIDGGYDVVQGHCVVRNGDQSFVSSNVAAEFETIYAVSHPGRARWHGFGIFGGSNGYWRTEVLRGARFRNDMLTEDIDSSIRAVSSGIRIANDPYLVSTELAPTTLKALWSQRIRWAQGWFQVMRRRSGMALGSKHLSSRQKIGMVLLLSWTQVMPWVSLQMLPLIGFAAIHHEQSESHWLLPALVLTSLVTVSASVVQTWVAWLLAHPSIRSHKKWFFVFALVSSIAYAELKNVIVRVAQVRDLTGQEAWIVTPRAAAKKAAKAVNA